MHAPVLAPETYRPRRPAASPLYGLLERFFPLFRAEYATRYAERYGPWRPAIDQTVHDYLACGDLQHGFSRIRCPRCRHEFFVAFSCRRRCLCPSCHQKRALMTSARIAETVCAPVPHRQFVFTMPRNLRGYFRRHRELLRELPRLAWETVREVYGEYAGPAAVPGMITFLQTFGELVNWHPHIHALVTDGVFLPPTSSENGYPPADATFLPLPACPTGAFHLLWRERIFALLVERGCITRRVVHIMRSWKHSGFSVDRSVRVHGADSAAIERLVQYMSRCPFSLERFVNISPDGHVFYRTENAECRPFAYENEDGETPRAVKRNFQHFKPLDFIADLTQHIPEPGEHLIRHYGWYANKTRGLREKRKTAVAPDNTAAAILPPVTTTRRKPRWATLIKRVYDTDPLICPKCGGKMKLIAVLDPRANGAAIEAILRHAGLWRDAPARAPPPTLWDAAGADQDRPASQPYPLPQTPAASQPELFYIADGDSQGFRDDDSQQAFPDYD